MFLCKDDLRNAAAVGVSCERVQHWPGVFGQGLVVEVTQVQRFVCQAVQQMSRSTPAHEWP